MASKGSRAGDYNPERTALAEKVLLEVWSRLGDYHDHLVLIGGLAPRYIIPQKGKVPAHAGTMDVDLGISIAVAELRTYRSIRDTLIDSMGFRPGLNPAGREQRHSFVKKIGRVDVSIDFLTTHYNGPDDSLMKEVEQQLSAIQVEGLGLAFIDPLQVKIEGELLSGGLTSARVRVVRPIPFLVLKSLAFHKRRENKDVYDIVYVLQNYTGGPEALAGEVRQAEQTAASFQKAMASLGDHFRSSAHNGSIKYKQFTERPHGNVEAFAAVQDFLNAGQIAGHA